MRYRVDGLTVRSENAAKSLKQPNKHVMKWILGLPESASVLDFGCGKLRYTVPLSRHVSRVVGVDSRIQLSRTQKIGDRSTTAQVFARTALRNVEVLVADERAWCRRKYRYILCANVLSAIPSRRQRVKVLKRIKGVLQKNGELLVVVQFRNTYFRDFRLNKWAKRHYDGWLIRKGGFASFYGLIPPLALRHLCGAAGLKTVRVEIRGESAFLFATI